ncbi:MAG TPA: hypothetical protein VKJ47_00450 [Candidatus Binatia bacterium]|nr:hypothetical protein [Candidatus Binatia bacterium]
MVTRNPLRPGPSAGRAPDNSHPGAAPRSATAFTFIFLNLQLWLLAQAVEGTLRGEGAVVFSLLSGLCFLAAWRLWRRGQG